MRFNEISNDLRNYVCMVRVFCGGSSIPVKTTINSASQAQARALLCHLYGASNVISLEEYPRPRHIQSSATSNKESAQTLMAVSSHGPTQDSQVLETPTATRLLSPDEQRVKAISDQAERLKQQAKQMKAQRQLKSAQAKLNAATKP